MLNIKNLEATIDNKLILKGLNLDIKPGEVHAIMGPNGSGKSTLANVLSGKNGYEIKGEVKFNGESLSELSTEERAQKGIFLAFQYPLEIPGVNTNIFLKTSLNSLRKAKGEKEIDQAEGYDVDAVKSEDVLEEKTDGEHDKLEELQEKNIDQNVEVSNEKITDTNTIETNKIEYQDKTLEALDSVREAVTKSLDENVETQNTEIKNNANDSKDKSNEVISEINLINTLFKNIREISNEEIENVVKSKVIELAEGVIGYQIEKFPEKFVKKIKNSINEIKSINNDIKIYLNDTDFGLLKKFLESNNSEINFKLDSDAALGRGDFTIDIGGVIQAIKYKKVIE